jgi:hypothetical protein
VRESWSVFRLKSRGIELLSQKLQLPEFADASSSSPGARKTLSDITETFLSVSVKRHPDISTVFSEKLKNSIQSSPAPVDISLGITAL